MFEQLPHLQKRHNKYGIRMRVPDDLRDIIGKTEITRSLRTGDPVKAKPIYYESLAEIEAQLAAARNLVKPPEPALLTIEMAESLAQRHFQEQIFQSETHAYRICNDPDVSEGARWQDRRELLQEIGQYLHEARLGGEASAEYRADKLLKDAGFPAIAASPALDRPKRGRSY